ncbi:MAG: sugar transferase [Bryobacterales bacterium]|nr:sugar transferase [Bryobacterales bacterium]
MKRPHIYARFLKSPLDRLIAAVGLVILLPLIVIVFATVRILLGKPALFRQVRTGQQGRFFRMMKFRSMTEARDRAGRLLDDAQRLTPFGAFLRASSLDELPQLWNVVRGDMSLVGPRPLLPEYLPRYSEVQRRRHDVKPGITGLAQVSGRNALSWNEKFELDVSYAENVHFKTDVKILVRTVAKVFRRAGVSRAGHATMPPFMGSLHPKEDGCEDHCGQPPSGSPVP